MMGTMMVVLGGAGVVILGVAAGVTRMLSNESASARHLVWTVALGLLLMVPVIHLADVRVEVPVPAAWLDAGGVEVARVASGEAHSDEAHSAERRSVEARPVEARPIEARPVETAVPEVEPAPIRRVEAARVFDLPPAASPLEGVEWWSWSEGAAVVWFLGAMALFVMTFLSHLTAYRLTTRDVSRASPTVNRRFVILAGELGIRPMPRLVVTSALRVPATWGLRHSTVILPDGYEEWSEATIDRVLLHELAHVHRRDCVTYLLGEVARAVHWPNPLAWLALQRQRAESERACDDLVLNRGVAASDYAADLLRLVRVFTPGTTLPRAAMAMARPSSGLAQRVRAVLDPAQSRSDVDRRIVRAATVAALGVAFVVLSVAPVAATPDQVVVPDPIAAPQQAPVPNRVPVPVASPSPLTPPPVGAPPSPLTPPPLDAPPSPLAPPSLPSVSPWPAPQEHCVFQGKGRRSTSHSSEDNSVRIRWEADGCSVDIDMEGDIEFASDDSGIVGVAPGSSFEIEERLGRVAHRARFVSTRDGFERRYWLGGDETAWGPDADTWLAGILPEIFRHTTINAEPRLRRMLAEGGSARVFQAVEEMHTDHVRSTYLELLLDATDLADTVYLRVIDYAGSMESDHTSGELLIRVVEHSGPRLATQALLRAAEGIESDHQKSRLLEAILEHELTVSQLDAVVRSASTIDSDHNLGVVLSLVARSGRLSDLGRENFLDALESIESDHNHGLVVAAFLDAGPLTPDEVSRVLEMTRGLESDHERGTLLRRVGSEYSLTGEQATAYLVSAAALTSDHEVGMTAQALTERRPLSAAQLDLAFEITSRISSDHSRATTLQTIITRQHLTDDQLRTLLDVAEGIGSSHQLATVLMAVAESRGLDGEARTHFERLAEGLNRTDRERALEAIRR